MNADRLLAAIERETAAIADIATIPVVAQVTLVNAHKENVGIVMTMGNGITRRSQSVPKELRNSRAHHMILTLTDVTRWHGRMIVNHEPWEYENPRDAVVLPATPEGHITLEMVPHRGLVDAVKFMEATPLSVAPNVDALVGNIRSALMSGDGETENVCMRLLDRGSIVVDDLHCTVVDIDSVKLVETTSAVHPFVLSLYAKVDVVLDSSMSGKLNVTPISKASAVLAKAGVPHAKVAATTQTPKPKTVRKIVTGKIIESEPNSNNKNKDR